MRFFFSLLILVLFSHSSFCEIPSLILRDSTLFAAIDLQKGFSNDKVSVKVNGTIIFRELVVDTHPLTDFTGISLEIYSRHKVFVISFDDREKEIGIRRNKIVVLFKMNGKKNLGLIYRRGNI